MTQPSDALEQCNIHVKVNKQEGPTHYNIIFAKPGRSVMLGFRYDDKLKTSDIVPVAMPASGSTTWYGDAEDARTRQNALQADPRMKERVTLKLEAATLPDALQKVAAQVPIDFVGEITTPMRKRNLDLENLRLDDALDQLASRYKYTWGQSKSGVFVFHLANPNVEVVAKRKTAEEAFLVGYHKLPDEQREQLQSADGMAYDRMPAAFQLLMTRLVKAEIGNGTTMSLGQTTLSKNDLSYSFLRVTLRPVGKATAYTIRWGSPDVGWSTLFTFSEAPKSSAP